jgi:hypothetical protein
MKILKTAVSLAVSLALAATVMISAFAVDIVVTTSSEINKAPETIDATEYAAGKLVENTVTVPKNTSIGVLVLEFTYDDTKYELVKATPDQNGRIITIVGDKAYYDGDTIPADGDQDFAIDISKAEPGKLLFAYVSTDVMPGEDKQTLFTFTLKSKTDATIVNADLEEIIVAKIAKDAADKDIQPKDAAGANMGVTFDYKGGRVPGDANDDGKVLANDAALLLQELYGATKPAYINMSNMDVNGDGKVLANDAALLLQYLYGAVKPELK